MTTRTSADSILRRALLAALLVAPGPLAAQAIDSELVNRIVLRVDDQIATLADWEHRKADRIEQIAAVDGISLDERRKLTEEAGRATMKEIFEELLVLSRARQLHLEASPAEIDRAIDNAKRSFGIEDDAAFHKALVDNGFSVESFRARMTRSILFNRVMEMEVQSKVKVEDDEVVRHWRSHQAEFTTPEQRRVEDLVVREDGPLDAAGRAALAADLAARMSAGATATEALEAAAPPAGAVSAVDLGWVEGGTLAPELDREVAQLEAGGVSAPIAGRGGLHVLRVAEFRPSAVRPLAEVREQIVAELSQGRYERMVAEFLERQAALAWIVEDLPADAIGYRSAVVGEADPLFTLLRGAVAPAAAPAAAPPPDASAETPADATMSDPAPISEPSSDGSPVEPAPPAATSPDAD